ncbi:DNA-3-methyladenine glycosylase I [Corynebacterium bovis]|uniref:DNA-3-methyladenine glycosylase I n=1 Tax=Corynebacterium bovis TaxID=36808 RepID=A0A3R8RFM4_9CORY|nr:DNA-3-methyladenine glycosylase I [Corynebacterium bovis]RRO88476.1 DNA-3-methyladenine glycosylase I [Corynebacterium bovis]RRO94969.1 DNA-3-methyladenine glycosylase I [Corynebacterium bovis]RRO95950.1 DNA-3-methyladenine glycosylase I [Corynebacterium bovis]RRO98724.1 DNA-3-methyladenine glycosylase I [Corynebacterium bovis]RRQ00405.1 DNA-3-methyladenine glycosylase I [Corynebacterium bovis]
MRGSDDDGHRAVTATGLVLCDDGRYRPPWATDGALREYYDTEWGRPVVTEHGLLERVVLEGFQAGLSWSTVLAKRPAFREVFHMFHPELILDMDAEARQAAREDARLIRNGRKMDAVFTNAAATVALRDDPGLRSLPAGSPAEGVLGGAVAAVRPGLPVLLWSFTPERHVRPRSWSEVPTTSPESEAMAAELRRRGFVFVGPTTCYALMQAVGMVDDRVEAD